MGTRSRFCLTAQEIATAVERLLQVEVLAIENEQEFSLPWLR
jgi:hypothetical protein